VAPRLARIVRVEHLVLALASSPVARGGAHHASFSAGWRGVSATAETRISRAWIRRSFRVGADFSVLATAFDTLIAVLVQVGEILPQLFIGGPDDVPVFDRGKFGSQITDSLSMEFVLVGLEADWISLSA